MEMERVKGIEPSSLAWEAKALPLSYTRNARIDAGNRGRRQGTVKPLPFTARRPR
jgi:hypothetical protein